jgi:ferritin-like metal-binding protein YciE/gas vesicle protein
MNLQTFRKLYINQLRDIYDSETQIVSALSDMESAAHNEKLKMAFRDHRYETQEQIRRLETIFQDLNENARGETCQATRGLIEEAREIITAQGDPDVIDAGLIATAQKIEHYEMANYGTVATYAKQLGEKKALKLLGKTLEEEKKADKLLTTLAKGSINQEAQQEYEYSGNESYNNGYSANGSGGLSVLNLLLGAAAGVAIGMLLAPYSGTDTRRRIGDTANSWVDQLNETVNDITGTAKENVNRYSNKAQDYMGKAQETISETQRALGKQS